MFIYSYFEIQRILIKCGNRTENRVISIDIWIVEFQRSQWMEKRLENSSLSRKICSAIISILKWKWKCFSFFALRSYATDSFQLKIFHENRANNAVDVHIAFRAFKIRYIKLFNTSIFYIQKFANKKNLRTAKLRGVCQYQLESSWTSKRRLWPNRPSLKATNKHQVILCWPLFPMKLHTTLCSAHALVLPLLLNCSSLRCKKLMNVSRKLRKNYEKLQENSNLLYKTIIHNINLNCNSHVIEFIEKINISNFYHFKFFLYYFCWKIFQPHLRNTARC